MSESRQVRLQQRLPSSWPGIGVFLCALILFATTANRGAQWQDSGYHILRIVTHEPVNPLGLALSHPLHHWLGRLAVAANFVEPAFAVTLVSAMGGAVAVMLVFVCVCRLTASRIAACLSAGALALAHTFWQNATRAECNTLAAAFLAAEACCIAAYGRDRRVGYLILLCFVNGLALANHPLALLTTPIVVSLIGWAVYNANRTRAVREGILAAASDQSRGGSPLLSKEGVGGGCGAVSSDREAEAHEFSRGLNRAAQKWSPGVFVATAVAAWIIGASLYLLMILSEWHRCGDFTATLHSALFGREFADEVLNVLPSLRGLAVSTAFILLNFPNLLLPAAVWGIFRARPMGIPSVSLKAFVAALVLHAVFALRYPVVDQHTFLIPTYVLLTIFGGIGFAAWMELPMRRPGLVAVAAIMLIFTPIISALVPTTARRFSVLASVERHKPYRDDYVYMFTPWSCADTSAEVMSKDAVRLAQPNGTIFVEDPMASFAIRYQAIRLRAHEVTVADVSPNGIATVPPNLPIVLVPADKRHPRTDPSGGTWMLVGELYVWAANKAGVMPNP